MVATSQNQSAASSSLQLQDVLSQLRACRLDFSQYGLRSLALFGSVARDEATPDSDLDFLVDFDGEATFDRYMDLKFFLEDLFDRPVDLVTLPTLKSQIRDTVLQEAIYVA